jgi:hypothetical protein
MYRWNKQYCNLFYRDTMQIAFDLYGIISRNEQLLMQEEGGLVFLFVLWHSNAAELLRDEGKKLCYDSHNCALGVRKGSNNDLLVYWVHYDVLIYRDL